MNLQVEKKDGRLQPFEKGKIVAGLMRSGASSEEAENVASQVEAWAVTNATGGVLKSLELRTKVLEILKTVNQVAAISFENYQKPQPETIAEDPSQA